MQLLRFKCKVTGRTYQEENNRGARCSDCAFNVPDVGLEHKEVQDALYKHCVRANCINRKTIFVEVTE